MIGLYDEDLPQKETLKGQPVGAEESFNRNLLAFGGDVAGDLMMAGAGVSGLIAKGYEAIGDKEAAEASRQSQERFYKFYDEKVKPWKDFWTPDPALTSGAGRTLGMIGRFAPAFLFAERAGALITERAVMGTSLDLAEQGVKPEHAVGVGIATGLTTAGQVWLPAAGGTLGKTVALGAASVAGGVAERAIDRQILKTLGYDEQAAAYDPFDASMVGVDTFMAAMFGYMGLKAKKAEASAFEKMKTDLAGRLGELTEDPAYRQYLDRLPIEADDALNIIRQHQKLISETPFDSKAPKAITAHLDAMNKALEDLAGDRPVNISTDLQKTLAEIAAQREADPVIDYRTGEALKTPEAVRTALAEMETEQKRRDYLLKSGDDMVREAQKAGVEPAAFQEQLKAERARAAEQIAQLHETSNSDSFRLWELAAQEGVKPQEGALKRRQSPADLQRQRVRETVTQETVQALEDVKAEIEQNGIPEEVTVREDFQTGERVDVRGGEQEGYQGPERRQDTTVRQQIDDLIQKAGQGDVAAREELHKLTREEHGSGLLNGIGYRLAPKRRYQMFMDLDNFKQINDRYGYDGANQILREIGRLIDSFTDDKGAFIAARTWGDEFEARHDDPARLQEIMNKVDRALQDATIEITRPDGSVVEVRKVGFSYGIGETRDAAIARLKEHKAERAAAGHRFERGAAEPVGVHEDAAGRQQGDRSKDTASRKPEEVTPQQKRSARLPKNARIISWIEDQGRINYQREHLKGELDQLAEGNSRIKQLLNKKNKGLSLDQLALRARDEGFIREATPEALLEALAENRVRPDIAEDTRNYAAEAEAHRQKMLDNEPAEDFVERVFADGEDIPGGEVKGTDTHGNPEFGGMGEVIDKARADLEKYQGLEEYYKRIALCIEGGG